MAIYDALPMEGKGIMENSGASQQSPRAGARAVSGGCGPQMQRLTNSAAVNLAADSVDRIGKDDSILLVKNLSLRLNKSALPEPEQYRLLAP